MLALQKIGPTKSGMKLVEVPAPEFGPFDILVEVYCVGICGSDLHIWRDEKECKPPVTLGHEFAGKVIAAGKECQRINVGDRVCSDIETINGRLGTHVNGACANLIAIPEILAHKLPDSFSYEEGAMVELVTCMGYTLMHRSRLNPSDFVAVLGPGPIGLTLLQMIRLWTPRFVMVTGLRSDDRRLEMARKIGADQTWHSEEDPVSAVMQLTEGVGADLVIDATGGEEAIGQATRMVRIGGWITIVGLWGKSIRVNLDLISYNCLTVRGGWGWGGMESGDPQVKMALGKESWRTALKILSLNKLNMKSLITRRITLDHWEQAYKDLEKKDEVKVMIYPNPDKYPPKH